MSQSKLRYKNPLSDERFRFIFGLLVLFLATYFALSFFSFLLTGGEDQSKLENLSTFELFRINSGVSNWGGVFGAFLSNFFVNRFIGLGAFFIVYFLGCAGYKFVTKKEINLWRSLSITLTGILCASLLFSFVSPLFDDLYIHLGGEVGLHFTLFISSIIGYFGAIMLTLFLIVTLLVLINDSFILRLNSFFSFNISFSLPNPFRKWTKKRREESVSIVEEKTQEEPIVKSERVKPTQPITKEEEPSWIIETGEEEEYIPQTTSVTVVNRPFPPILPKDKEGDENDEWNIEELGEYDPTLDLSSYKLPSFEILDRYENSETPINVEEQTANKNRIIEVLGNFGITIQSITATPGPTVTLYEIVPDPGIRIAKIKNLEDDIALSLAALGIRIIAPIPGKGTIGIEVPNKDPRIVSMRSILSSKKFQESKMDLPVAIGKTITNEIFIVDLCKMPHVLVAGATGQGKSVGLNAIITSLLYKKHPAELKFVLIDPKKVEFPIYSAIEKHFLAKLPDGEEAIITDVTKVVQTLLSITREMDDRYMLLNKAHVRNVKEYNLKFTTRKLNPEKGHRFLPYIVVIIDEFGDLIMTAGKEVELPIARIAQLARAVGIHMVIATQRPSVNIITGVIKTNFPARVAFRVSSMIDSRTILDCPGANQLIGRGDMLISQGGGDLTRVQCAFIDTEEVERVAAFIGEQRGYPTAYYLPEVSNEENASLADVDLKDRDPMFEEAARLIVATQQGSTSMIQRKLSLGFNRSGRLMDQLEKAGIVGPSESGKPRQVFVLDDSQLEMILNGLR